LADRASHLHRWTLAAEREAGADPQRAAGELDRQDPPPPEAVEMVQHRLDVGDAAPGGLGSEAPHEPHRDGGAESADRDRQQDAPAAEAVGGGDEVVASRVSPVEGAAEEDGHETRDRPDEDRTRQQVPPALLPLRVLAELLTHLAGSDASS